MRSVVPTAASRSLWLSAIWTGAGTSLVAAVVAIVGVAVCWLPASGGRGNADSVLRAGVLTSLAALHGGITVDGLDTGFVPLGMTVLAGVVAWRAGAGLGDAAEDLEETEPGRLLRAAALQTVTFAGVSGVLAALATLGTSSASVPGAVLAALVLFAVTGGVAFVRDSALADVRDDYLPGWIAPAARVGAGAVLVYLAAGALLVLGSLIAHHGAVDAVSARTGGGWSGLPVLLIGVLAAPNASIAGAAYLAGPGFAVGSGTTVALGAHPRGVLPAFPVLGAVPTGPATWPVWTLVAVTPLAAGTVVAALAGRAPGWASRWRDAGLGVLVAALLGVVLAWQGGGAIGSGRLHAVGASPWRLGLAFGAGPAVVAALVLAGWMAVAGFRARRPAAREPVGGLRGAIGGVVSEVAAAAVTAARRADVTGDDTTDEQRAS